VDVDAGSSRRTGDDGGGRWGHGRAGGEYAGRDDGFHGGCGWLRWGSGAGGRGTHESGAAGAAAGTGAPEARAPEARAPGVAPETVAYEQFQEAVRAREQLEQQLGQLAPYAPLIEQLAAAGLTAEQTLQYLVGLANRQSDGVRGLGYGGQQGSGTAGAAMGGLPGQTASGQPSLTPEQQQAEAFNTWLRSQGADPEAVQFLDPMQQMLLRGQYQQHQMIAEIRAQHEAAERAAIQAELTTQMQTVHQQFPVFQNATLERALYAQFAFDAERGMTLQQSAEALAQELQGLAQSQITEYAAQKREDASVPVGPRGLRAWKRASRRSCAGVPPYRRTIPSRSATAARSSSSLRPSSGSFIRSTPIRSRSAIAVIRVSRTHSGDCSSSIFAHASLSALPSASRAFGISCSMRRSRRFRQKVCKWSGGNQLSGLHSGSIVVGNASRHFRE